MRSRAARFHVAGRNPRSLSRLASDCPPGATGCDGDARRDAPRPPRRPADGHADAQMPMARVLSGPHSWACAHARLNGNKIAATDVDTTCRVWRGVMSVVSSRSRRIGCLESGLPHCQSLPHPIHRALLVYYVLSRALSHVLGLALQPVWHRAFRARGGYRTLLTRYRVLVSPAPFPSSHGHASHACAPRGRREHFIHSTLWLDASACA